MTRRADETLAVIIGRAGSKGLPGKNATPLAGRPMICHTIEDALHAESIDRVIVSTDGQAIAQAAESMGIDVVHRPAALASDTATVDAAVRHAVETIHSTAAMIVILYANVPLRPDDLIDRAVHSLIATGAHSVQSYSEVGKHHPYWMVRLSPATGNGERTTGHGQQGPQSRINAIGVPALDDHPLPIAHSPSPVARVEPFIANTTYRRQDLPKLYIPDGGVIAVRRESLFTIVPGQPHAFLGSDRRGIVSPPGTVVDVDTAADFKLAESILAVSCSPI